MSKVVWYGDLKLQVKRIALFGAVSTMALIGSASASTVNLSAIWDFIDEITSHQTELIGIIILVVILFVVKRFGKGIGKILDLDMGIGK